MLYKIKRRIFKIIELDNPGDTYSKTFKVCIITLIFLSILVVIISTVEEIYQPYQTWLDNFELISVIIFTIEYILRVWSSNVAPGYKHPVWGRIRFMVKPLAIIDLIAILPFYLPYDFPHIPAAMWWGIITLTTVGYGDVYPITPLGRFLGAIVALVGVGIFALPAGIVASGFTEEIEKKRASNQHKKSIICPHCGQKIDEQ